MSTQAIIKQENIQTIVSAAPQSFNENRLSCERCIEAGQAIVDAILSHGMTDELDQQAAIYIEKARKTVKKMNERRAPVTQLFDVIRKQFTAMENEIDPTKVDTIPYKLQQFRNQFATQKLAEEEERRRRELERQQAEAARLKLRQDMADDYKIQFSMLLNKALNRLSAIDNAISLNNFDDASSQIANFPTTLSDDIIANFRPRVRVPLDISDEEALHIYCSIKESLTPSLKEQYEAEIANAKQLIIDRLPSKKANLQRIAQASAEEAARIKAEMEARQRKEAEIMEAERRRKEEEEKQKAELARQQTEMESLFGQQAVASSGYIPKVKVAQKINLLNPEGIMPILSMWWSKEGCHLSIEELAKMFKKQIAFCEKLAKEGTYIADESVEYIDDIRAK